MKYKIIFSPEAVADFKSLKANVRSTVRDAIEKHLRFEPAKESKSRKLKGTVLFIKKKRTVVHAQ